MATPPFAEPSSFVSATPVAPYRRHLKSLCLLHTVLSGRGIDDKERLVGRSRQLVLDHPPHLRELLHEVRLRVQPAGGVDDDDGSAAALSAASIASYATGNKITGRAPLPTKSAPSALRPDLELFLRLPRGTCRRHARTTERLVLGGARRRACRSSSSSPCRSLRRRGSRPGDKLVRRASAARRRALPTSCASASFRFGKLAA